MNKVQIFNSLNINSYLELGIDKGETFNAVDCKDKTSVDINYASKAHFTMSTDDFFEKIDRKYDLIFIDACHEYKQVIKDLKNAIQYSNKYIAIHDLVPPNEGHTMEKLCGDGYKLLHHLIHHTQQHCYVFNSDYGVTFLKAPFSFDLNAEMNISYKEFMAKLPQKLTGEQIIEKLKD